MGLRLLGAGVQNGRCMQAARAAHTPTRHTHLRVSEALEKHDDLGAAVDGVQRVLAQAVVQAHGHHALDVAQLNLQAAAQ